MQEALQRFGRILRQAGLRISSAELIDALRACQAVGIEDAATTRAALAATMVKRPEDRPTFDTLFDLFFRGGEGLAQLSGSAPLLALIESLQLDAASKQRLLDLLAAQLAEMSAMGRVALGVSATQIASLVQTAGLAVELGEIRSPLQVGFYSYRLLERLGFDDAETLATQVARQIAAHLAPADGEQIIGLVAHNMREFRQSVRSYVQGQFQLRNPEFRDQLSRESLADKSLSQLRATEIAAMRGEIRRLAHLLKARMAMRRRAKARGTLDFRKTTRASLATGGVPFVLRYRYRPRRKPRLVVLCDVSDSVRNVSRFMLQFTYMLQELFSGVHSFAFVAELAELSELFRKQELERALEQALSGAVVNVFANSNYGQAFAEFSERHLGLINRKTTVLIIGDGRNNYHPARAELVGEMRARCRQLIWLNPEAPAAWGFGDSAMHEYHVHCDKVVVAYSLRSLERVVDDLLEADA